MSRNAKKIKSSFSELRALEDLNLKMTHIQEIEVKERGRQIPC